MGFAGYLGLLVTALNLMPIGQLDGGHILFALSPRHGRTIAWAGFIALLTLGLIWPGALFWAFLLLIIGINHPQPRDPVSGLTPGRRKLGLAAMALFAVTFIPVPFIYIEPQPEPPLPEDAILVQHQRVPSPGALTDAVAQLSLALLPADPRGQTAPQMAHAPAPAAPRPIIPANRPPKRDERC